MRVLIFDCTLEQSPEPSDPDALDVDVLRMVDHHVQPGASALADPIPAPTG